MFKTVFALTLLLVVKVLANPLHSRPYKGILINELEKACVVQGGLCVRNDDCDPGQTVRLAELCPLQRHLGVVCCYEV